MTYDKMNRNELINACKKKDIELNSLTKTLAEEAHKIYNKEDIKRLYNCENDKALRILKVLFQMGYANKIGKEYYISYDNHSRFLCDTCGLAVNI